MRASGTTSPISNVETGGPDGGSVWVNDTTRGSVFGFGDGVDSTYVRAGDIPLLTLDNDFTWAFWANHHPDNTMPNNAVLVNRKDGDGVDFEPRQFVKYTPTQFEWHMNGNRDNNAEHPDFADPAGTWQHHGVVKKGADIPSFLNGAETSTSLLTQSLGASQPLFLGGDNQGSVDANWQGMLDEVRIYDHPLLRPRTFKWRSQCPGARTNLVGLVAVRVAAVDFPMAILCVTPVNRKADQYGRFFHSQFAAWSRSFRRSAAGRRYEVCPVEERAEEGCARQVSRLATAHESRGT